jgi:hypothetical protein
MTFLELCKATRQECGIQGNDQPASVTGRTGLLKRVVDWVRDADEYIQRLHPDWDFLWAEYTEDTITGLADLTAPTDIGHWDRESFAVGHGTSDGRPLAVMSFRELRSNHSAKEQNTPTRICILPDKNLRLEYPPDGEYEIYANYWKAPVRMSDNTDTPLFPEEFQRAIIARAKMWFFEDTEALELYQAAEKEFRETIRMLEADQLADQYQLSEMHPEQIVIRPV